MILANLRKMFFSRTADSSTYPTPHNGSTSGDSSQLNNYNGWIESHTNRQGNGCDFPLNNMGYWYSNQDYVYSFATYRYKVNGESANPGFFVGIGTGNTAESSSDYSLVSLDSSLEHRYGHVKRNQANGVIIQVESVYENLTGEDVVIKEIGLYAGCRMSNYNANWTCNNFLIARKVLSSPVTIHNNEVYKFIYKLDI